MGSAPWAGICSPRRQATALQLELTRDLHRGGNRNGFGGRPACGVPVGSLAVGAYTACDSCAHAMHLQTPRKNSGRGMGNQGDTIC